MRACFLKDLYVLVKNTRIFLVLILATALLPLIEPYNENTFLAFYPYILCSAIVLSLLGYDERYNWLDYCESMPVKRAAVVGEKYIIALALYTLTALIHFSARCLAAVTGRSSFDGAVTMTLAGLCIGMLITTLLLPILFKVGVEKGRLIYTGVIILSAVGSGFIVSVVNEPYISVLSSAPDLICVCAALAVCALYLVSWRLSVLLYLQRIL